MHGYVRYAGVVLSFGLSTAVTLYIGFRGGQWLDRHLGTDPIFLLAGVLGALALGFYNLLQSVDRLTADRGRDGDPDGAGGAEDD